MTLISGNLTIDEQAGFPNDGNEDDVDYTTWAAAHTTLVTHLNSLQHPSVTGFPQVAERTDMIDFSGLSGIALKLNGSEGLSTGFTDIAGNAISLYTDSGDSNIILGKNANGDVSFAVVLDAVDAGATITSANMYVVMYEALFNPKAGLVDSADPLDLTGLINLRETTTTFTTTFEPLNFAAIPSGSPQETLTVPTTDPNDNHSVTFNGLIFPGEVTDPTTVPKDSGTNDDLNPDAVGFGVKGGQASQMNQNEGFFAQDSLWTTADLGTTNHELNGLRFDIQGIGGIKAVNVEWWTVNDGTVVDHETDTVSLPSGNNVFDNFDIIASTGVDQIYVRFFYDTKPDTSGVRVENFETLISSTTPSDNTVSEDIGGHVIFQDDFPSIGSQTTGTIVDFSSGSDTGDVALINLSMGVDKPGEVYFTSLPSGWTADDPNDDTPNSATDSTGTFNIVIDNDSYKFSVLKDPVLTFQPLNFASIPAGNPEETLTVPTTSTTDNHSVTFNGLIFPDGTVADPTTIPKDSGTNDDLNPDSLGFGVKGGQASQLNQNEGFFAQDSLWTQADSGTDNHEIFGLRFDIQGIGGTKAVNVEWWTVDDGSVVDHATQTVQLPSGNNVFDNFDITSQNSFDQVYVRFTYDTKPDTSGVRLENFEIKEPNPVPDQQFTFGINAVDQDGDPAQGTTLTVGVDGNHDGSILIA